MRNKTIQIMVTFIIIVYYIWFRFIRERLPRDIPFMLSLLSCIILLYICILYLYIILHLIKPKPQNIILSNMMVTLKKLIMPITILDNFISNNQYLKAFLNQIFNNSMLLFKTHLQKMKSFIIIHNIRTTYLIIIFTPKIIMLLLLLVDIYHNKLALIYIYIYIPIIELILYYLLYLFKLHIDNIIKDLDKSYMVEITSKDLDTSNYFQDVKSISYDNDRQSWFEENTPILKIDKFILLQTNAIMFDYDLYNYKCYVLWELKEEYAQKNNIIDLTTLNDLSLNIKLILEHDFYRLLPLILYNKLWLNILDFPSLIKKKTFIQIIIYLIYFISWLYILLISLPHLHLTINEAIFLVDFQDNIEPFSNIKITSKQ